MILAAFAVIAAVPAAARAADDPGPGLHMAGPGLPMAGREPDSPLAGTGVHMAVREPDSPLAGPLLGFSAESSRRQRTVEAAFLPLPEAQRCESLHRELTAEPHVAGTDGGRRVAEIIARRFREYGLETEIESYEVLLSFPRVVEVEMTAPRYLAALSPLAPGAADRETAERLRLAERDLLAPDGIPDRPWFRHLVYAPLPSYAAETLPGVREAVVAGDSARAARQAAVLADAIPPRRRPPGGPRAMTGPLTAY